MNAGHAVFKVFQSKGKVAWRRGLQREGLREKSMKNIYGKLNVFIILLYAPQTNQLSRYRDNQANARFAKNRSMLWLCHNK